MKYVLALHLIAIVCWFAGLFYLPRLFVYHAMTKSSVVKTQLKIMEHKLYYYIMAPAFIATFLTGFYLLIDYLLDHSYLYLWLWLKLFLVFLLILFHYSCGHFLHQFKKEENKHSDRFYRCFNEIPTVLLILIMFLAVVQPF